MYWVTPWKARFEFKILGLYTVLPSFFLLMVWFHIVRSLFAHLTGHLSTQIQVLFTLRHKGTHNTKSVCFGCMTLGKRTVQTLESQSL